MRLARDSRDDDEIVRAGLTLAPVLAFAGRDEAARETLASIADSYNAVVDAQEPAVADLIAAIHPTTATRSAARTALARFERSPDALLFIALSHQMDGEPAAVREYLTESATTDAFTMAEPILAYLDRLEGSAA